MTLSEQNITVRSNVDGEWEKILSGNTGEVADMCERRRLHGDENDEPAMMDDDGWRASCDRQTATDEQTASSNNI